MGKNIKTMNPTPFIFLQQNDIQFDKNQIIGEMGIFTPRLIFGNKYIPKKAKIICYYSISNSRKYICHDYVCESVRNPETLYTVSNRDLMYKVPVIRVNPFAFCSTSGMSTINEEIKITFNSKESESIKRIIENSNKILYSIKKLNKCENLFAHILYLCLNSNILN